MSFFISGDTHGTLDLDKVIHFFDEHEGEYSEEDYLIICGDVGVCGFSASGERATREALRNFGHFHQDEEVEGQFFCLYDDIIELE